MPEPLVVMEAVTLLSPEGRPVFRDLHWRLDRGARLHAPGGAGGGCTALLRLCAGIAEPAEGRIILDGVAHEPGAPHPFLARGALGWVPSDGGLAVNLSLLANVALPLRFALNQDRREAERTALGWLDQAGLGERVHERPAVHGNRESWMASLARAGAKGSRLWLVDRPHGGLDLASIQAAERILAQAAQDPDVTLLLVGGDWMARLGSHLQIGNGQVSPGRKA